MNHQKPAKRPARKPKKAVEQVETTPEQRPEERTNVSNVMKTQKHCPPLIGRSPNYVERVGLGTLRVIDAEAVCRRNNRMAELTYDPTPADQGEFTAEELDSLAVGEQMMQAEEQLLAGKYKNAEQLEKLTLNSNQNLGKGPQC